MKLSTIIESVLWNGIQWIEDKCLKSAETPVWSLNNEVKVKWSLSSYLVWTATETLCRLLESLNHTFSNTGQRLSWGSKVGTNEELIQSVCVCVCARFIARTGNHGGRGGFIAYDIIKSARKEKSAFSSLSLDGAATPAPSSSSLLLLRHRCPRTGWMRRRRMRCRRRWKVTNWSLKVGVISSAADGRGCKVALHSGPAEAVISV